MPQHHMVIPHYMGRSREIESESRKVDDNHKYIKRMDSFSSQSSVQEMPLLLPQKPDGLDAANGNPKLNGLDMTHSVFDQSRRVSRSLSFSFRKLKVQPSVQDVQMKGFVDDLDFTDIQSKTFVDVAAQSDMLNSDKDWWETQERGYQAVSADEAGQVGPRTPCCCQVCYISRSPLKLLEFVLQFLGTLIKGIFFIFYHLINLLLQFHFKFFFFFR